jgi:predicted RNase H-like HicB family nuclease
LRYFSALIHKDPDSAYGLSFPDLPGVFAAAESWDGIAAAAAEALDLWFNDMPDILPAPIDALSARPEIIAQIRDGAALIAIGYDKTRAPCE